MPKWCCKESHIHGTGLFSTMGLAGGEYVGVICVPSRIPQEVRHRNGFNPYLVTSNFGKFINHSGEPNCRLMKVDGSKFVLVSKFEIGADEELTLDYDLNPYFLCKPAPEWK